MKQASSPTRRRHIATVESERARADAAEAKLRAAEARIRELEAKLCNPDL